jgi:hypothetical protein
VRLSRYAQFFYALALSVFILNPRIAAAEGGKVIGLIARSAEDWYGDETARACGAKAKELHLFHRDSLSPW